MKIGFFCLCFVSIYNKMKSLLLSIWNKFRKIVFLNIVF
ncbi:hypothetical protein RCH33_108 [Flavobacterium daejeonense]|nr:hypothetical protein RCH33_108 [Flavobacterium daejeonense]